jgi:MtrB/PioB family decaheme-associated outer membrane protein
METRSLKLSLAVASILFGASAVAQQAAQPNTSEWACSKCPFPSGYSSAVDAGVGYVSDSSAKFGDYRGLEDDGAYALVGAEGSAVQPSGYRIDYELLDLGTDAREVSIEGGKQGQYGFSLFYDRIPHTIYDTSETIFDGVGSSNLALPSGWVRAGSTKGMKALQGSLRDVEVGLDRDRYGAAGYYEFGESLTFAVDYRRDERDGTRVQAFSFGSVTSQLLRPIDDATDRFDATLRYQGGNWFAQVGYFASVYDTAAAYLRWQNPFTSFSSPGGGDVGQAALPPDNDYNEISLSAGWFGLPWNTTIGLSAATGKGSQDVEFLPYTINPQVFTEVLPIGNLDGDVSTMRADLTISMRPIERLRVRGGVAYDERENDSAQALFTSIVHTDLFPVTDDRLNSVYGYERTRVFGNADFDVYKDLTVGVGGEYRETDRTGTQQEVESETLSDGWGRVQYRPTGYLGFELRGGVEERDPDNYSEQVGISLGQNPLMRRYYEAYRYRAYGNFAVNVALGELPLTLSGNAYYADDSYNQSQLGLVAGLDRRYTFDLTWAVNDGVSVYVNGGKDLIDSKRKGASTFGSPDWRADISDEFETYGGGLRAVFNEKIRLDLDYTYGEGKTDTALVGAAGGSFPTIESTMNSLRADFTFPFTDRLDFVFSWLHESMDSHDWQIENIEPNTVPTVLGLGIDPYDYSVDFIGASVRYYFGPRGISPKE